jgi:uncharacterized protein with ACT and thioredoxin-like domain
MPHDLLCAVRSVNSEDSTNIFEDAKTVGNVLPEKASIFIQNNAVWDFRVLWNHRECNSTVTDIGIENSFKTAFVTDLSIIHGADTVSNRQDLRQLKIREPF